MRLERVSRIASEEGGARLRIVYAKDGKATNVLVSGMKSKQWAVCVSLAILLGSCSLLHSECIYVELILCISRHKLCDLSYQATAPYKVSYFVWHEGESTPAGRFSNHYSSLQAY